MTNITDLLAFTVKNNASDLHLSAGLPPLVRINGDLQRLEMPVLDHQTVLNLLYEIMKDNHRKAFEENLETDFSFDIAGLARFRTNVFHHDRGAGGAFRLIPSEILSMEQLNLPKIFKEISMRPNGLVLVTGPTGSGKSTTLSTMIDYINHNKSSHIITIEDPLEFVHQSNKCLITQREVDRDTRSFSAALRSALREDPDIILIGEMRDLETIRLALTAAETGHLVFATLHTSSAAKTVNRIIDVFPAEEQAMVRTMLSESLQAVISQTLLKNNAGGRTAGLEIMICNTAIRNLIRENKVAQMYSAIQTGQSQGMQTLDQHLKTLIETNLISKQTAREVAVSKDLFI